MTDSEKLDLLVKEVAGIKLTLENEQEYSSDSRGTP